jgi:hypothetical protein
MLPALAKPILRCSSKFTVFCLRKFVARKLAEAASAGALSSSAASLSANISADQIDILCGDEVLGGEHNLRFIKKTRWFEAARELELGYRLRL